VAGLFVLVQDDINFTDKNTEKLSPLSTVKMSANREGRNPTSSSKWWHTLNGVDPITLEPLSSLPHPPFVLEAKAKTTGTNDTTSSRGQAKSKFYFDGEALAEYLTTSANFCNPMNRDPLSKADCQRLDEYLVANSLKQFNVHQLFAVSKNVAQGRGAQPVGHARQVALIVNNMFGSTAPSSHRSQQSGQRRPQQRTQASRDSETRHDGTTPDWPSLALSASTASTRSGNTTSAENPQYAYNRHEMGSGGGLRVIDDSEWVEEAIVPKNESSAAPVQWPKPVVEQRAPQVASGKHNDTALSWRSKRASNDKPTSSTFARRERPRLKLLPRTKPVETSLPSGSAARVSRSHGHHQTAPRPSDLRVSGFPVSMLLVTAQGKRQWVAAVEKVHFTSLVEAGMQNKSASWSPPKSTSSSSLRLLVCLAEHWGIAYNSETTVDGQVVVTFTAARDAFPPSVFLSDVVLQPFVQQLLQPSPDASANKRTAESDTEEPLFWSMQAEDPEPDIKSGKVTQNLSLPNPSTMRASVLLTDIVLPAGDSANRLTDEYIERCVATSISNDRGNPCSYLVVVLSDSHPKCR